MFVRPRQSQYDDAVRLINDELSFVDEFRYLRHVLTPNCRDNKDVEKELRKRNAIGDMLIWKFSFAHI